MLSSKNITHLPASTILPTQDAPAHKFAHYLSLQFHSRKAVGDWSSFLHVAKAIKDCPEIAHQCELRVDLDGWSFRS